MERGFEQLILMVVIIVFSLAGPLVQWVRKWASRDEHKRRPAESPVVDEVEASYEAEVAKAEEHEAERDLFREWLPDQGPREEPGPELRMEPRMEPREEPRIEPILAPRPTVMSLEELLARRARPAAPARPTLTAKRSISAGRYFSIRHGDVRRGIVLMAVLGPCKAEEMDRRGRQEQRTLA